MSELNRPNVLLITSDQQHWNTLGCLNPEIRTPNLDRLAESGTLFTRAYCPNPTCTPTRASIITGKYPSQHGGWTLGTKLPESEQTLGALMRRRGYRAGLVGKAHFQPLAGTEAFPSLESYPVMHDLDFWRSFHGPFYGFDHVELARNHTDEAHVGQHYALWMEEKGLRNWRDYFCPPTGRNADQRRTWGIPEAFHYDAWIADRTNRLLERYRRRGEPFFLWASFFDPHPKYLAPEPWDRMYDPRALSVPAAAEGEHEANPPHFRLTQEQSPDFSAWQEPGGAGMHGFQSHLHDRGELAKDVAVYYGMISLMDKYIGRILDRLETLNLRRDTLVVFTTDHGHFFGHHGLIAKGPFHYEDMIRVPFVVSWPGRVPAGQTSEALQSLVDLAPSFLAACGLDVPADMTGIDQSGVWRGARQAAREHVIVEHHHQPTTIHLKTCVDARYKLTIYRGREYGELFDLEQDPGERRNLWNAPGASALKAELMLKLLQAELRKEEPLEEGASRLPHKSGAMYVKTVTDGRYELTAAACGRDGEFYDLAADPGRCKNLWREASAAAPRAELVRKLLFDRMAAEPVWMPRIHGA